MTRPRLTLPLTAAAALLALAGCSAATPPPEPAPAPTPPAPGCGAEQLGAYLGRDASDDVLGAIRGWRGPDNPVRVLKPDSIMTMDYRPDRLNVYLDDKGRIREFKCN